MKWISARLFTLTTMLCLSTGSAHAQLGAHIVSSNLDHAGFGNMLGGAFMLPLGYTRIRVGPELLAKTETLQRSMCVGLIPPGQSCDIETVSARMRSNAVVGEVGIPVVRGKRLDVELVLSARWASVSTSLKGRESGKRLRSSDNMYGGSIGVATTWYPWTDRPFGVQVSGALGKLRPTFKGYDQIDGFDVITDDVSFNRATLGVTYRF